MSITIAIRECFEAAGGRALTIAEVKAWLEARHPRRWKDVSTPLADLVVEGSASTLYPIDHRFLRRVGRGVYALAESLSTRVARLPALQPARPATAPDHEHAEAPERPTHATARFSVRETSQSVEGFSATPIPWPPRDWTANYAEVIRSAIRSRAPQPGEILHATMASSQHRSTDAENALLYNVGLSHFRAATIDGLHVERLFCDAYDLVPGAPHPVYVKYHFAKPGRASTHWQRGAAIARWSGVALGRDYGTKAAGVWSAIHRAQIRLPNAARSRPRPFGLSLTLHAPRERRAGAQIVKPLVDGAVAAFHHHDAPLYEAALVRAAADCGQPVEWVRDRLRCPERSVFGGRDLLRRHGSGAQWNPADEWCVVLELVIDRRDGPAPTLDGHLYEASERLGPRQPGLLDS